MRTANAGGRPGGRPSAGFTLIEVLVVLVILSIALSLVVVNFTRDRGALLEEDARRLALLLQFAHDEAIVGGRALAWAASPQGYSFSRRERGEQWIALGADDALAPRAWPSEAALAQLRIAGVQVPFEERLIFAASGINPPYDLVLASGDWRITLSGDLSGRVALSRAAPQEPMRP